MLIKGIVYKFGDNINTDVIYPGKYLSITTNRQEMAKHCFETVYPEFLKTAHPGDVIVAGKNFGCGSSREQAATCLKYFGISAIVAESFARIFYRNAINLGIPVLESQNISTIVNHLQTIKINLETGEITNMTSNITTEATKLPPFILEIITAGGLILYLRKKLGIKE